MRGAMLSIDHLAFSIIDVRCYKCYSHPLKTVMIFCWCCRWTDGWCRDRRHCLSGGGWPTGVRIRIYFCFGSAFLNLRAQNRRYLSMVLSAEEKQARVRRLRHGLQSVEWVVHWPSSCSRVCLSLTQKDKMEELCEWCTVLQEASVACGLTFDHVMILAGWFWIFSFFLQSHDSHRPHTACGWERYPVPHHPQCFYHECHWMLWSAGMVNSECFYFFILILFYCSSGRIATVKDSVYL